MFAPLRVTLVVACLVWSRTGVAAEPDPFRSVVTFELRAGKDWWVAHTHVDGGGVDGGQDVHASPERPLLSRNAVQGLANERLEREFIPLMIEAADAGIEPARWQVGLLYLHGWYGVPVDVTRAERILWQAPPEQHHLVAYALGKQSYRAGDGERGERLLLEAYKAGVGQASHWLCSRAADLAPPFGRGSLDRAESLVATVSADSDDDVDCLLALAAIRHAQGRYTEAYGHALRADQLPQPDEKRRKGTAWKARMRSGLQSGDLAKLNADELMTLLTPPIPIPLVAIFAGWAATAAMLVVLIWRTWATRARPVGLLMASVWISVPASLNGLGLLLPLVKGPLGWWFGAAFSAVACVVALRLRGAPGPYGNVTKPLGRPFVTLAGAMLVAVSALAFSWDSIYLAVFGSPMKAQFIVGLLRVSQPMDVFWTLLFVAGFVPYVEEVCFRGFLYDALDARWGGTVAVIVSAVIFGFVHIEPVDPFSKVPLIIVIGLCLGLLRQRSGDLRLGMLLHGANNALAVLAVASS